MIGALAALAVLVDATAAAPSAPADRDAALIARHLARDPGAFAEIYRAHVDAVFRRLTRILGPLPEREDLTQDVFLALHRALPRFRGEAALGTLIQRIAINTAYEHLRGRSRRPASPVDAAFFDELVAPHASPEARASAREDLAHVFACLGRIKPKKRIALLLRLVDGLAFEDIARLVDATPEAVAKRVQHAQRELDALLGPEAAVSDAVHACDGRQPGCLGCAAIARRQAEVRAAMTRDDRLDDVTRARIWSRLEDRLDARAAPAARGRGHGRWVVAAAAVAAIASIAIVWRGGGAPAPAAPLAAPLIAPADTTLTTRLGPHTHAALVGPARLAVVGPAGDATTVRLDAGTLYASFDGGAGRSLRVLAPGAVVEVVGTLFAVDAGGARTCVSVAHGRVRVTMGARIAYVAGGEKLCTGDAAVGAIEPAVKVELVRHEAATTASASPILGAPAAPDLAIAPPPPAPPPPAPPPAPPAIAPPPPAPPLPITAAPIHPLAIARAARSQTVAVTEHAPPQPAPEQQPAQPDPAPQAAPPAPAPAPQAPRAPAQPPPPSDDDLYRAAEAALAHHDAASADRALAQLLVRSPASPLADQALYERARIAYARHAWSEARGDLEALAAFPMSPLVEPGRYLACRIEVEAHDADAPRCLTAFRDGFPGSPHDLDVLGLLAQLAEADGGCAAARPFVDALAADHDGAAITRAWRARCPVRR